MLSFGPSEIPVKVNVMIKTGVRAKFKQFSKEMFRARDFQVSGKTLFSPRPLKSVTEADTAFKKNYMFPFPRKNRMWRFLFMTRLFAGESGTGQVKLYTINLT